MEKWNAFNYAFNVIHEKSVRSDFLSTQVKQTSPLTNYYEHANMLQITFSCFLFFLFFICT